MATRYYPLINKLITRFRLQEKQQMPYQSDDASQAFPRPFITIAREPGSGGRPIAQAVARHLGFRCIDEQLIDDVAQSTKLRRAIIQAVNEKSRSRIEDIVHAMINPEYIDDMKYLTALSKVILSYAHQGQVVIVGRGANFITPFAKGLHVNITAPYEVRVRRAMQYEGFTREQAEEVISQNEKERKSFVKQYLLQDPNKLNSYDLSLNTTLFSVDQSARLIVDSFYRKFPRGARYRGIFHK